MEYFENIHPTFTLRNLIKPVETKSKSAIFLKEGLTIRLQSKSLKQSLIGQNQGCGSGIVIPDPDPTNMKTNF